MSQPILSRLKPALLLSALLTLGLAAGGPRPVAAQDPGELVYALTDANRLVQFRSNAPGTLLADQAIGGLPATESLRGLDFRPASGELYALGASSQLYKLNPGTGAASIVGSAPISPTLSGTVAGFDFNPVPDRIRILSTSGQNLRVNPDTGAALVDGTLAYKAGDPNVGQTPNVVAAGYVNPVRGAAATQLFVIDSTRDVLALQAPPNDGVLSTIGALGVNVGDRASLDISVRGTAYVSYAIGGTGPARFGTLNAATGAITEIGPIGQNLTVTGIALPVLATPESELLVALSGNNSLILFRSDSPSTVVSQVAVTGLPTGETLRGIDFRPATGGLYALGASSQLYTINLGSGAATAVGSAPITPPVLGTTTGFDFNPVPDRIRIISGVQNLRVNPDTGAATVDGALAYKAGDPNVGQVPNVVAAGYTNSVRGATSTALYVVDADRDVLALQAPPNDGVLATIGALGPNVDPTTAIDITPRGTAYIAYTVAGATSSTLGLLDLASGKVIPIGTIGGTAPVIGLAAPARFGVFLPKLGN